MNTLGWTLLAAPCLALTTLSFAPQAATPRQPLAPVAAQELSDPAAWRERFQSGDLGEREKDFESLVARASESEAAREKLESWTKDEHDLEFAWTCRLALREVKARDQRPDSIGGINDHFEQMRRHLFGHQGDDPFQGFLMLDPFARGSHGGVFQFSPVQGGQSESESFSMQIGPEGLKARLKRHVDGEVREEEYTANSIEELLAAHPELAEHVKNRGMGFQFQWPGTRLDFAPLSGQRTDKLGVYVPATPEADATGLRIQSVVAGTIADELGLQAGEVLLTINGRTITTRDDISAAMRERSADAVLEVEVQAEDGSLSTKSWKAEEDAVRGRARPLVPRSPGNSRKI